MAKAILVLNEMPIGCEYCPCNHEWECGALNHRLESLDRPDWCPLVPMPERKKEWYRGKWYDRDVLSDYGRGYNDCLDEIGGAENE